MADAPQTSGVAALLQNKLLTFLFAVVLLLGIITEGVSIWRNVADTQLAQVNAKLADANTQVALLTAGKTDAETKLVAANTLVATLTADKTAAETRLADANSQLTIANTQVAILTQQKTVADTRLANAQGSVAEIDAQNAAIALQYQRRSVNDPAGEADSAMSDQDARNRRASDPASTGASAESPSSGQGIVTAVELNVHLGANDSTRVKGKLAQNQIVDVFQQFDNGWLRTRGTCKDGKPCDGYVNGASPYMRPYKATN